MKDLKIAQVVCVYPPYRGGIGNVAYHFSKIVKKYYKNTTVITPQYIQDSFHDKNDSVQRLKPLFKYGNGAFIPQIFWKVFEYDVIHLHYPFFGGAELVCLAKLFFKKKFKLIVHYHMDVVGLSFAARLLSIPSLLLRNLLFRVADQITCASFDYIENSSIKNIFLKYRKKFYEIPFGVDLNIFRPSNIKKIDHNLLFVGGLDKAHYFKGLDVLIDSLSLCKNDFNLFIVGEGELKKDYKSKVKKLNLERKVKFVGGVSNKDLVKYYQNSDIFVLPSINKCEAFGLVLLEAMATALPVIASDLPGVRSVFNNGVEGIVVDVGNKDNLAQIIDMLLGDPEKSKGMGKKGRKLVEKVYNWDSIGQRLKRVYEK